MNRNYFARSGMMVFAALFIAAFTLEGKFEWTGGTGKFQNIKGGGAYTCKGSTTGNECNWEGEVEY